MDIDMSALRMLVAERDIPLDRLVPTIEQALLMAYQRTPGALKRARAELDRTSGHVTIWATELDEEGAAVGEFDDTPNGFGRVAASTARQVILQRLREADDDKVLGEFKEKEGELVSGVVQQGNNRQMIQVNLGTLEAVLPPPEQVPGEQYPHGRRLRTYVVSANRGSKGPSVTVSRSHPNLVRRLFELEVPEIADGSVEITALAREAGHRTKMAVKATRAGINAKGAAIGEMGSRVRAVMTELGDEKIDIVEHSDDPAAMIAHALSPAQTVSVEIVDADQHSARVVVPQHQLSLAIGKEGQNARLAAKLTGWRIDIVGDGAAAQAPGH
ncbi:transcription termination factor NusA [Micrococcus sp. EYE_162]|uniref:transcription termination factor NusA n=1 Tax=unclassified Micrococcus TaxID=2620948 RepID=UPI0020038896|nr:transcription termination factor NusA [Micrococcus sp. M4NT]MCK6094558.1 transcription termination factor NusA [Micrococcus sp. EYE_212]MCK6172346.1 transcription termination factor NusA [Micrococcus sp. EYE_162]MDX2340816.1 transcription termination factor NusA [Micrococcus sp. M4NT]